MHSSWIYLLIAVYFSNTSKMVNQSEPAGVVERRHSTDKIFLLLIIAMWVAMVKIISYYNLNINKIIFLFTFRQSLVYKALTMEIQSDLFHQLMIKEIYVASLNLFKTVNIFIPFWRLERVFALQQVLVVQLIIHR